jgi:protein-S-isoprenylcysteine O-methyltransferase Ste14
MRPGVEFGKPIAFVAVVVTMLCLSFQHSNSITGAATGGYTNMYAGVIILFLVLLSIAIVIEYSMRRHKHAS